MGSNEQARSDPDFAVCADFLLQTAPAAMVIMPVLTARLGNVLPSCIDLLVGNQGRSAPRSTRPAPSGCARGTWRIGALTRVRYDFSPFPFGPLCA